MSQINLTNPAKENLDAIKKWLPDVENEFLVETALALTAALYQKVEEGSSIQIRSSNGKLEELRFKTKKSGRRKSKSQLNE